MHNYCIILAGGVGARLWPMSRAARPKQFLDPLGTGRSLLQTTYDRMARIFASENIYIATCIDMLAMVEEQLPEVARTNILAEPLRRGTLPAAFWANTVIRERDEEACVLCTPADQLILREADFERDVQAALGFVRERRCVLTMGVRPSRPDTFYGYIQADDEVCDGFARIKAFAEKPNKEFARLFVESGEFYWNTGINLWHAVTMQSMLRTVYGDYANVLLRDAEVEGDRLSAAVYRQFESLPNTSLDLTIQDKLGDTYLRICSFGWADLGNWHSIHDDLPSDRSGNVSLHTEALMYDCTDNIVRMPQGTMVVMKDLHNMVVAQEDGVLLIAPKDDYAELRRIMTDAQIKHR